MKKQVTLFTGLLLILPLFFSCVRAQEKGWVTLFDGETLDGWSVHSGFASYHVDDGCIVGTTKKGSPNTFLCTDNEYGDFILEFEVLLESSRLNSGVQFRSKIAPQERMFWFRNAQGEYSPVRIPKDRVYGYQVEIAEGGGAGGVYDEARRAMMPWWPEAGSEKSKVFKPGAWNQYRVECTGDSIKTVVNGMVINQFRDGLTERGIIGLQVHDVGDDATPYTVRWRNIRIKPL